MYPIDDDILIEVYDEQPLTPDKLAGSPGLAKLGKAYHERAHRNVLIHDNTLLQRLIDMRKDGKLPRKTDRVIGKPKPEGWPKYKDLKTANGEKFYEVKLTHRITLRSIAAVLHAHMDVYGNPRPLTRGEVYQLVAEYAPAGYVAKEDSYSETIIAIAEHLFPELS